MKLDSIPRVNLSQFPTPLENAPRLAKNLGLRKLLVKRDDASALATGGNKVRKLEYLIADALAKKADVVLTDGGPQSNHARLTAAAVRKVGIERCILYLGGPKFDHFYGNLLLDVILGAEIRFMEDATVRQMEEAMNAEADELKKQGHNPYVIPIGGSTPLGILGYVNGIRELASQLSEEDKAPYIFVGVGSAGTFAGCALGIKLFLPEATLIGISVAGRSGSLRKNASKNANAGAELIGVNERISADELIINDEYYGERYGVPTEAGNNAVLMAAQSEALILDPIYTGKAMSGLIDMAQRKIIDTVRTAIFLHTGGGAGLSAFEGQFRDQAKMVIVPPNRQDT